jgi:hypothetical protein
MQQVKNPKNRTDAEQVLIDNGFKMPSGLKEHNAFQKDGQLFKISHPVWDVKTGSVNVQKY